MPYYSNCGLNRHDYKKFEKLCEIEYKAFASNDIKAGNYKEVKMVKVHPTLPHWLPSPLRKGWLLSGKINKVLSRVVDESVFNNLSAVEGQINIRQCAVLFYFAYARTDEGKVVEIGSFKGKSTVWLAKALQLSGRKEKVFAMDPHVRDSYETFLNNISRLNLSEWVESVKSTSEEAAKTWNQIIKLIFIDGSHRYEDVLLDLQLWVPRVKRGGVVVMDDTDPKGNFPGVVRAIREYRESNQNLKEILRLGKLTVYEKTL
jgi:predicted O-methyltransferase YrrM